MDIEKACDIEKGSIKVQKEHVSEYTYIVLNILGLYICYLASTVVQEEIYSYRSSSNEEDDRFESAPLNTFSKSIMNLIVSHAIISMRGRKRQKISGSSAICCALLRSIGTIFSLYALNFISYPHAVLGKSMKILPVFVADSIFDRKRVSRNKLLSVIFTIVGMMIFSSENVSENDDNDNNDWIGILLIFSSLCMDGAMSVTQKRMLVDMKGENHVDSSSDNALDTMAYMSFWQSILSFTFVILSIGDKGGIMFCMENPVVLGMLLFSTIVESFGQVCVYNIIVSHGSFTTAFVTTLRKFLTILISIVLFGHSMTNSQWFSILLIFCGTSIGIVKCGKKNGDMEKMEVK